MFFFFPTIFFIFLKEKIGKVLFSSGKFNKFLTSKNWAPKKKKKKKKTLVVRLCFKQLSIMREDNWYFIFKPILLVFLFCSCSLQLILQWFYIVHYHTCHDFWYPNHLGILLFLSIGLLVVLPCHTNEGKKRILVFTGMLETRLGQGEPGTFHLVCLLMTIFNPGNVKFQLSNPNLV